jgi:Tfp pilus assembly protein PilW
MHLKFQPEADPPMAEIQNTRNKIQDASTGFTLIELMVAMLIFMLVMGAMVAVSVAGFRSYGKSKVIKTVTGDIGFAINSIAKDVRMGKIESTNTGSTPSSALIITRNNVQTIMRYEKTSTKLSSCECSKTTCKLSERSEPKVLVDLTGTGMTFDATSGFRNQKTDTISATKIRGWAEINLNIENPTMEKDSIRVQTIVSSRDYGWDEL